MALCAIAVIILVSIEVKIVSQTENKLTGFGFNRIFKVLSFEIEI